jgi:ATP-dependent Clp protease ATP-binding subunit ClpC
VLESASTEAASLAQSEVAPEHLLVGLMHEPDGVAAMVMRNLGLTFDRLRAESFRPRLQLMSIVERTVRPVRTGIAAKRKMREELLAHVSAIYREELDRLHDPSAAMAHAAERFGDPAELSRELQNAVTWDDRLAERAEWWFAWRPTESVTKMMVRTSLLSALLIAGLIGMCVIAGIIVDGWNAGERFTLRVLAAMVLITPATQFAIGMIYYKMRDATFGVFGSRRSPLTVLVCCVLMALTLCMALVAFISITNASLGAAMELVPRMAIFAPLAAITLLAVVRLRGPVEILDTTWACIDVNAS